MGLFNRSPTFCAICNKELKHKHKPKREWNIKGVLCGDCHVDKMKEFYEGKAYQTCVNCGIKKKIIELWEPRWQWDMEGLLCKECCDIVIPSGMGLTRDFLNALAADGIIIIGGGSGTLSETCAAYMHKKPMVAIRNIGGIVEPFIDGYLDHRKKHQN